MTYVNCAKNSNPMYWMARSATSVKSIFLKQNSSSAYLERRKRLVKKCLALSFFNLKVMEFKLKIKFWLSYDRKILDDQSGHHFGWFEDIYYYYFVHMIIIIIIIASFMPHWKKLVTKVKADSEYFGIFW